MVDQWIMDRALARMDEIEQVNPAAQQPDVADAPAVIKPKKTVHQKPKPKEVKHHEQKVDPTIVFDFQGRAKDAPVYLEACDIFGLAAEDVHPLDRNEISEIIKFVARKLGTTDAGKILHFISTQSHKYSGNHRFREMYRMMVLGQEPTKKESPW